MAPGLIQEVQRGDEVPTTLRLTAAEETLRQLLLDVADYIDQTSSTEDVQEQATVPAALAKQKLCLRWAGGWVRDKLLGVPSVDIDVAINKMTGYSFGLKMKEYLEIPGSLEKYDLEAIAENEKQSMKAGATTKSKVVGGLHKIKSNPEKSKNLETTAVQILGLDIDLVNLRTEEYSDDSRNPEMHFGTAEEDAVRRDATVNAMFYNIHTRQVEDFTGRGRDDMKNKLLRTPLEPYQTFKDDPLRVLRLIRFSSRLGYRIDTEALTAMRNTNIKEALRQKISRERVGIELVKSLRGPDPHETLRLIFDLDLYETIFSDPSVKHDDHYRPNTENWAVIIDALEEIINNGGVLAEQLIRDSDESFLAWQLAAMVPYRDAPLQEAAPGRKPPPPIATQIASQGIKATAKVSDVITAAIRNQSEISMFVDRLYQQKRWPDKRFDGENLAARDVLGMAMRRWGPSWRSQCIYAMLVDIANEQQVEATERRYKLFIERIQTLDLSEVVALKPLLTGTALAKALATKPGPWMTDALHVVTAWQLRNPGVTDPNDAIEEVKNHREYGELTSDLIGHFLKLTIRPLFLKTKPTSVTTQGHRVATPALPKRITLESSDDDATRPWKTGDDAYALDLLRWVVASLDQKLVAEVWPLLIPPILTLVDDWEIQYKQMGVTLLRSLLEVTPPSLLDHTGLGDVFEEALLPCLTYLPTLTSQEESTRLLSLVYPTLLLLIRVRFADQQDGSNLSESNTTKTNVQKIKAIDVVLRKGVIYSYTHCSEYPAIVATLFDNMCPLLDALGIDSVKHIKYVLPMITETLCHPLSTDAIPMLQSAVAAVTALLRNCWPRMLHYRGEVLKGLCLTWLGVHGMNEGRADVVQLRRALKDTVRLLQLSLGDQCHFESECRLLVEADERLGGLFDVLK